MSPEEEILGEGEQECLMDVHHDGGKINEKKKGRTRLRSLLEAPLCAIAPMTPLL